MILDNMDDLGRPQGSYPESFVSLSSFLAEIRICCFSKNVSDGQTDRQMDRPDRRTEGQTLLNFNIDILEHSFNIWFKLLIYLPM